MRYSLGNDGTVKYAPAERDVFRVLNAQKKKINSIELTLLLSNGEPAYNGVSLTGAALRSLARKVELNDEPFRIMRTRRAGPKPISWWVEKKA